ncbi:MAG: SDR family NAD(P)-dependent oxidoreductase [Gordonia sp. (in: high G+C Gram-positive bacteria)]|uniref:SDR family NAD(P)-dependent oxidoreductase n=1 Tax=Gordonia sp. (in: high G+C Gram-positive bacteria) TaxID=84139 RepID=UPI003BB569CD
MTRNARRNRTWFITGAGRGLGREFTRAALESGDHVAATARDVAALDDLVAEFGDRLVPIRLDVTDRAAVHAAVAEAHRALGRLDVVINNAGYGLFGAVEEISEDQLRAQLEVNLFGPFHVCQAVAPILREQNGGHIIQISTVGGVLAFPNLGGYHASKWALEGMTESLAAELAPFGVRVTLVEPGPYGTEWSGASAVHATEQPQYQPMRTAIAERAARFPADWDGEPAAAGRAMVDLVDAQEPPLRVFFGVMPAALVPDAYVRRLELWEQWRPLSVQANGT